MYNAPASGSLKLIATPAGVLVYQNTFVGGVNARGPASNVHFRNNLIVSQEEADPAFADKILGRAESTDMRFELQLRGGGSAPCEISSMPIRAGTDRIVGVFGIATPPRTKRAN